MPKHQGNVYNISLTIVLIIYYIFFILGGYPCDFESADICGFKTNSLDGISWKRIQAKTIQGKKVGAKVDKTYGTEEGM